MNPLHETFQFLYLSRSKKGDPNPAFGALMGTTILAYLNLLVVTLLTNPFTGYFSWLGKHGVGTLMVIAFGMFAVGAVQYFCWIYGGRLERERAQIEGGARPRAAVAYLYIAISILAVPAFGIFEHHLKS